MHIAPAKRVHTPVRASLLGSLVLLAAAIPVGAATHTWKGATSGGLWSNGSNWTGGVPTSGEVGGTIVQFGSNISSTDNIAGLAIDEIIFTGGGNVVGGSTTLTFNSATATNVSSQTGSNSFASTLSLVLPSYLWYVTVSAGTLTIDSNMTGTGGGPILSGAGTLDLNGTNSWPGAAYVNNGTMNLNSSAANGALPSDIHVGDGTGGAGTAVVTELSSHNIANTAAVYLSVDGRFDLNGYTETIAGLNGSGGSVTLNGAGPGGNLTVSPSGIASFGGVISGTSLVRKIGAYTQVLSGNNTYTGATDVAGGTLILNGSQSASAVTVQNAAFLFGAGTIGPVTALAGAGISAGGLPPGSPPDGGPGLLSIIGALSMSSGSTFIADLNGTAVGSGYDRVAATGPASIAGVNLQVNVSGFAPTGGMTFTILTCSALTGTFAGQVEGSLVTSNGFGFTVHYTGTSVILTACTSLTSVSIGVSGSTTVCSGMGGLAIVTDTGGGTVSHSWGYKTMGNPVVDINGQNGNAYQIDVADFPGPGSYSLVCTSYPQCGAVTVSNEIPITIGDPTAPTVTAPADENVIQSICQ